MKAPNRPWTIAWIDAGLVRWRMHAPRGLDGLQNWSYDYALNHWYLIWEYFFASASQMNESFNVMCVTGVMPGRLLEILQLNMWIHI